MPKPSLYEVEITYRVMVAASDAAEAERYAQSDLRSIVNDEPPFIRCAGHVAIVGSEWQGTIAWGDNPDELTCDEIAS